MAEAVQQLNKNTYPEELKEVGPNVFHPIMGRGLYFIFNEINVCEGAIYCSDYRDVITYGLGPEHADIITSVIFVNAIEGRGIFPLQTLEGSIPEDLRDTLGFVGPEKDQYTRAQRWILK